VSAGYGGAAWPGPGERWRRSIRDARPRPDAVAPLAESVRELRVRPGAVVASVAAGEERFAVALLVDVLGPAWRRRWLDAVGAGTDGEAGEARPGDPRVEAAAALGLDPVPPHGSVRSRCACRAHEAEGWCGHAAAVSEAVAERLDAGRWELLWHLRGLQSAQTRLSIAQAEGGGEPEEPGPAVDDSAFWGTPERPVLPEVEAWREAPAALLRLGPLPAARGQGAAVEPILAHYRRVRDAVRPTTAAGRRGRPPADPAGDPDGQGLA
jgi:hypothetical protein